MPEDFENTERELIEDNAPVRRFERLLEELSEANELMVADLDLMEVIIYLRLRSIYTLDQMHARAHVLIQRSEDTLHMPGALRSAETGEVIQPVLVENFQGSREELMEMLTDAGQGINDEDLAGFFGKDEEE